MADLKRRIIAVFSAQNKAKGATAAFRRDMDNTGQAMRRMAKGALAIAGVGGGLYAFKRGLEAISKASMAQESAERALSAATGGTIAQYKIAAAEMQRQTIYGDEMILQQMAYGINLGITKDKLKEATKAAIGLAAKYRLDLASSMMLVGRASQGQTQMLTRYGIILDETLSDQEKFDELLKIGASSFRLAGEETRTAAGAVQQMRNAMGDLKEMMGEQLLPVMTDFAKNLTLTAQEGGTLNEFIQEQIGGLAAIIESIEWLDKKRKEMSKGSFQPLLPEPRIPSKEWYMERPEKIPAGIKAYREAGRIPPKWMWSYIKRAEEAEALMKEATEFHEILVQQAKKEADVAKTASAEQTAAMQEHYEKITAMGGTYQEMQERMARQRTETEIAVVTQQMEAEIEAREKAAADLVKIEDEALDKISARSTEFAMTFRNVIASGFERSMRDADNWKEHMLNMFEEVYWASVRMAFLEPLAGGLARGLTRGLGWAFGEGIFGTPAPTTPTVFTSPHGGPALQHGGIVERTGWAKVHRGETFSGIDKGGAGGVIINVNNAGMEKFEISQAEQYWAGDQRVVDIFITRAQTDGGLRRAIKSAAK